MIGRLLLNQLHISEQLDFIDSELKRLLKFEKLTKEGEPVIYYKFAPAFEAVI